MSNIRQISDPAIATAMLATMQSIDSSRSAPSSISQPRWRILQCIAKAAPNVPTSRELMLCSGLNRAALAEHVQALQWKGLLAMGGYRLSPSAAAMVGLENARPSSDAKSMTSTPAPTIIGVDLSSRPDISVETTITFGADGKIAKIVPHLPMDPADVPACMRPDCLPPVEPVSEKCGILRTNKQGNKHGRGSAAVARPIEGDGQLDRVAPDRALPTTEEVAGSNPAPGQPAERRVADLTPELVASLRAGMPARKVLPQAADADLVWTGRGEQRDDGWQSAARAGSAMLLDALRRHHPERCGAR
ncbi:hypothetical protein ATE69_17275 [Sphingopyxis sp. H071]|nr:hypothetical protein ATE61_13575 [Sphingopyxis sp. H057]KTE50959.1 hypothetical protein ATE69_17275 [Sphingopyxis sp. H071]KTE52102.1 hypothetical protein ATE64_11880 [Sphingopyxis sp. H073]KTE60565.1 hypothetical protein ATE66_08265 [Sphingopyxis sp. H107]KTE63846.1 hypothetical protein ATE65_13670 [Sphingopyxis sp. H100]KTE71930.1 hypothetical protein ATE60_12460 [Sphingopyxis sp. H081]KTE80281.1 hypothetical protein ATE63_11990 [Sphingopyxis sp. H067]